MNDLEALRQAVLASPDDDILKLIYADALDEDGQSKEADSIRAKIEIKKHEWTIEIRRSRELIGLREGPIEGHLTLEAEVAFIETGSIIGPVLARDRSGILWRCNQIMLEAASQKVSKDSFVTRFEARSMGVISQFDTLPTLSPAEEEQAHRRLDTVHDQILSNMLSRRPGRNFPIFPEGDTK